jgi:hypothetical protein
LEADLLRQVIDYLSAQQRRGRVVWFARRNSGGAMNAHGMFVRFYQLYVKGRPPTGKGAPDLDGMLPGGQYFALEIKRPGGKPTEPQAAFLSLVREAGGVAAVVSSYEEVYRVLFHATTDREPPLAAPVWDGEPDGIL